MKYALITMFLLFFTRSYTQDLNITNKPYRTVPIFEKSIIRIDTDSVKQSTSVVYLVKEKALKHELFTYFKKYITNLTKIQKIERIDQNDNQYLISYAKDHTIISLLHPVKLIRSKATFFILSSNNCVISPNTPLCYPKADGLNCLQKQPNCQPFIRDITVY